MLAVLLLPSLLLIGVFSYYPAVRSLIGGFYQWNGFSPPTYAGVSQFKAVHQVADVRHRGEEHRHPGRRQHPDHAGLPVHRRGDRDAPAAAGRPVAKYLLVLPIVLPPLVLIEVWAYLLQPAPG